MNKNRYIRLQQIAEAYPETNHLAAHLFFALQENDHKMVDFWATQIKSAFRTMAYRLASSRPFKAHT